MTELKCANPHCCRDADRVWTGRKGAGRPKKTDAPGIPYCDQHYDLIRGKTLMTKRAQTVRATALIEAADIAEHHGAIEVAQLLRKLVP